MTQEKEEIVSGVPQKSRELLHKQGRSVSYGCLKFENEKNFSSLSHYYRIKCQIFSGPSLWGDTQHRGTRDSRAKNIFYLTCTVSLHFNYIHCLVSRHA